MSSLSEQVRELEAERDGLLEACRQTQRALATARAKGAREALTRLVEQCRENGMSALAGHVQGFCDREYPASPVASEGARWEACPKCREQVPCEYGCRPTPSPEPERVTIPVESKVYGSPDSWDAFASVRVTITPELARRIFEMAFPRGVGTGSSAGGRSSLAAQDGGRDA